jgi:hypothetical protein
MTAAVRGLTPEEVQKRLNAVRKHALKFPAADGKSATIGFCWCGSASFRYATARPDLNAAVVYYGSSPDGAHQIGRNGMGGRIFAEPLPRSSRPAPGGVPGADSCRYTLRRSPGSRVPARFSSGFCHFRYDERA